VLTIYGIPNCDTCKKARKWLEANSVEHRFHDLRVDGLERATLTRWGRSAGWQKLLNTRSITWRGLPEAARQDINEHRPRELMLENPTLIKRPVLETKKDVLMGFSSAGYAKQLST
jgi:arsenate reductase